MKHGSKCVAAAVFLVTSFSANAATTEAKYPTRPIRFVVGFLPGGPSDTIARVVAVKLGEALGQPVVVENRAGAGGNVSADIVADANPDGHTILLGTGGPLVIAPIIGQKIGFDPDRDFAPVSTLGGSMSILSANPSLPANNVKELIALAKAKPGEINYASSGVGAANHLAAELLSSIAGIKLTHVPYKGSGAALPALISGEVKLGFGPLLPAIPHVKAGRLKALGVTGLKRATAAPDIPTIAEQGFPGFHVDSWYGLFVPARTPKPVIARLNAEIKRIMTLPDVNERLSRDGVDPAGSTPEQLNAIVQKEKKMWSKVIRESNIKVQ
ncbi:MAG TPA: tripartite tricarboxylate transporter substrate binding protein [Burkholderiales bacterium]|nr:tripartite tricarboxylate transporter substrate binding protein [Burkholderiales bacterium]